MIIYVEDYWNTLMEVHVKQLFHAVLATEKPSIRHATVVL